MLLRELVDGCHAAGVTRRHVQLSHIAGEENLTVILTLTAGAGRGHRGQHKLK